MICRYIPTNYDFYETDKVIFLYPTNIKWQHTNKFSRNVHFPLYFSSNIKWLTNDVIGYRNNFSRIVCSRLM